MDTQWQMLIRVFLKSEGKKIMDLKAESRVETKGAPLLMRDCLKSGVH